MKIARNAGGVPSLEIIVQRLLERTKENHNKPHNIACLGGHVRLSPRGMKSEAPLALWSHKTFNSLHFAKNSPQF
jgi:hypothetical protein